MTKITTQHPVKNQTMEKGKNDRIDSIIGLEKRVCAAIDTLRNKYEKADTEYGVLGLVVPKKVTDK